MKKTGIVFDIQQGGMHDGPGIRTVVFLKGCPLRCVWCHNAESIDPAIQPDLRTPSKFFGKEMSVAEVLTVVEKDRAFYDASGGGLTLSGGEPLLQFEFSKALLQAAREQNIATCLDTCGQISEEKIEQISPLVDLFHYDYKATDPALHKKWTGVEPERILKNLRKIHKLGANIILRCPIVPGLNANETHFKGIAALALDMPRLIINILPYHNMGRDKWERVGKPDPLPLIENPTPEQKEIWKQQLLNDGIPPDHLRVD